MTRAKVRLSEATIRGLLQGGTVTIRVAGVAEVEVSRGEAPAPGSVWGKDILSLLRRLCSLE